MSDDTVPERLSRYLADNLRYLRERRSITQSQLASRAGVPRSTLAHAETGGGNPTLAVLGRLASALQIGMSELLSAPPTSGRLYPRGTLPREMRGGPERATIHKLLPDPVPGMEIDRMELPAATTVNGIPHRAGTREYLFCESGTVSLAGSDEHFTLEAGDVCVFQGDQRHQYRNVGEARAVLFSVVVLSLAPDAETPPAR
jgi:transcriptional regulator with XRE-family HTH domain